MDPVRERVTLICGIVGCNRQRGWTGLGDDRRLIAGIATWKDALIGSYFELMIIMILSQNALFFYKA